MALAGTHATSILVWPLVCTRPRTEREHRCPTNDGIYGPIIGEIAPSDLQGSNITYCGSITPSEVAKMLSSMGVLVLPTRYQGEGHPGFILEAYAAGLPVVTTNFRSIQEIVHSHSGILVEPGDIRQLATAIRTYSTDSVVFTRARKAATIMARQFDARQWTKRYASYLQTLSPK